MTAGRRRIGRRKREDGYVEIKVREVPEQLVVVEQRMVDQAALEAWLPIHTRPATGDITWRTEPERREAYVSITKAQFEMPVVRSVYDAIDQWIAVRGLRRCGSPREIYHSGVDAKVAALDDQVADVTIPF